MSDALEVADPEATAIEKADVAVGLSLASQRGHPLVKAAAKAGEVSDQEPLYAISTGVIVVGAVLRDIRLARAGVLMLGSVLVAATLKGLVKRSVTRTRPHVLMDEGEYEVGIGGRDEKPRQSFPSGHAAGAAAAARALSRVYPGAGGAAAVAAGALGLTRIAKGAHYPLDVLGGLLVGLLSEALVDRAARWAPPQAFTTLMSPLRSR